MGFGERYHTDGLVPKTQWREKGLEGQVRKTRTRRHRVLNHGSEEHLEGTFKEQEES